MFQILIVEDDKELSQLFQKVLEKNGYQVKSASDGALALEILDKEYIDLIISDIMMPVMDGYELVSKLRSAGKLEAKYVFHAITIDWSQKDEFTVEKSINSIIKKSLNVLSVLGLKSIAFPAIGTGAARYSLEDVAHFMSMAISEFLSNSDEELEIYIYLMDRYGRRTAIDYIVFFEQFYRRMFTSGVDIAEVNPAETEVHAKQWDTKSMRLNHLNSYLIKLEEQRMNFEMKLIEAIEKNDNEQIKTLHYQLNENNKIRYSCMREIKEVECTDALNSSFKSVFLSSTFEDMKEYRKAIIDRIIKRRMVPICMENWGANANKVTSVITDEVKKADIYLGIFGTRYGYVDENTNMSMTEIEYREALASNKPILVYIAKNAKDDITTGDNSQKMLELLTEIEKERIVYYFNSIDQLGEQVFADLERYIK